MSDDDEILTDKRAILDRMAVSYRAFQEALGQAGPELLQRPGSWGEWTLKDLVAHLTYWHTLAAERLQKLAGGRGDQIRRLNDAEIDEINANVYRANRDRPLDEMQDALHVTYLALRTAAKSTPAAVYGNEQAPVHHWIAGNSYAHYEEHLADVQRARNEATG